MKMISTREWCAQHPFASQNTQEACSWSCKSKPKTSDRLPVLGNIWQIFILPRMTMCDSSFVYHLSDIANGWEDQGPVRNHQQVWNVVHLHQKLNNHYIICYIITSNNDSNLEYTNKFGSVSV